MERPGGWRDHFDVTGLPELEEGSGAEQDPFRFSATILDSTGNIAASVFPPAVRASSRQ